MYLKFIVMSFYLRFMQRLVPGARAQPEQHWWPPQTLGLNKRRHIQTVGCNETLMAQLEACIITEGLPINPQSNNREGVRPGGPRMTNRSDCRCCYSFRSLRCGWPHWYEHLGDFAVIAFSRIRITGQVTKSYLNAKPTSPLPSVMRESGVNTELSEPWEDYARYTGHEKHPASSVNHRVNERWQVLNSYSWILCAP